MKPSENIATIVLLNGTSSSGKTTLANVLVSRLNGYEVVSFDSYWSHVRASEIAPNLTTLAYDFVKGLCEARELIHYHNEEKSVEELVSLFHRLIYERASQGRNLIVDTVLEEEKWGHEVGAMLLGYEVLLVGVKCPLEILEKRESKRPCRKGFARYQFPRVHVGKQYDIEVDTSKLSTEECANQIIKELQGRAFVGKPTLQKFYSGSKTQVSSQ